MTWGNLFTWTCYGDWQQCHQVRSDINASQLYKLWRNPMSTWILFYLNSLNTSGLVHFFLGWVRVIIMLLKFMFHASRWLIKIFVKQYTKFIDVKRLMMKPKSIHLRLGRIRLRFVSGLHIYFVAYVLQNSWHQFLKSFFDFDSTEFPLKWNPCWILSKILISATVVAI
jgi:hypothetical protein